MKKRLLLALLFVLPQIAMIDAVFAQSRPVRVVPTMVDLALRDPIPDEDVDVLSVSTNHPPFPAPRRFHEYSRTLITNAHDGFHYSTNAAANSIYASADRGAMEQDASWFGAAGNLILDDTVALNAASAYTATYIDESAYTTLKGPGRGFLRIRPTQTGYLITNTVYLQSSTEASGAAIIYRGQKTNSLAIAVGPSDYTTTAINNHTFKLPDVWGYDDGFSAANSVGISLRSIGNSSVKIGYVYRFETGIQLLGDTKYFALNNVERGSTVACRYSVTLLATNSGFVNGNTWTGVVLNNENPNFAPGTTNNYELIRIDGTGGSINGNIWLGGSFEGFPGQRVIYIKNASANLFTGQRWEHHVSDYTNVVASKLYMEVESTIVGNGLNNRIVWPSQGINGMAGIFVKETPVGQATGNSGTSVDWQEYRSSDTGDYHGPIVLDASSTTNQGLGYITAYPYIAWPDTHFSLYTNWGSMLTGNGYRFKSPTNPVAQLYIENTGEIIQAAPGTLSFVPRWKAQDGTHYFYNDSSQVTMQVNRAGSLQFFNPATAISQGSIRSDYSGFFGGLVYSGVPTNTLGGITFSQQMDKGSLGWAGVDIVGYDSGGANYLEMAVGTFSTNHPYGAMQNGSGIWINSSAVSLNNDHFTIALIPTNTDFRISLGNTTSPSLGVDRDTVTGDTRLRLWVHDTNAPVRMRYDNTARLFYGGSSLSAPVSALVNAAGGSAGRVLTYVNPTTFAWSNAPSSFSFSDLTNALLMGSNMSAVYTSSNMTISSSGGGGATNGTALSVDGSAALSAANLADTAKINHSASGSNITSTIVADSLGTNDIDAATESLFLDLSAHTGLLAVLNGGTGIANTTAAGQALLAAIDAAAQRAVLQLGALALLNDAPTNGQAHGRQDGAWVVVTNSGGSGGGSTTISNVMQRVGWAEWDTVINWTSDPATNTVINSSLGGTLSAVYAPSTTTNGVAGQPPFPDSPFGIRSMRVNIAGTGITSNTVFVLKKLSLQTTNVSSFSRTNTGWSGADYQIIHSGIVSTNIPLILNVDPGYDTISVGSGLDLHTWTNKFHLDIFDVSNVSVAGGSGATFDSQPVSNVVSSATISNEVSGGVATPNVVGWTAPNKQIAAWSAIDYAPGTNASTVAQFAIRGDGIPALVFTNNSSREANFMGWVPSGIDLASGINVTAAVYSEGNGGASNVVLQAEIMRLCCTGSGALDTNAFATSGAVTSALPTTVSVPTNLLVALPTLTNLAAGDMFRLRLSFVVGSASDTNDFNRGLIGARMEAR